MKKSETFGGAAAQILTASAASGHGDRSQSHSGAVGSLHQPGVLPEPAWRSAHDRRPAGLCRSGRPLASAGLSFGFRRRLRAWPDLLPHSVWHNPAFARPGLGWRGKHRRSDLGSPSSGLVALTNPDVGPAIAAPEASTWVMMAIGFMGLGLRAGARARRPARAPAKSRARISPGMPIAPPTPTIPVGKRRIQSPANAPAI